MKGAVGLYTQQGVLVEPSNVIEAPFAHFVSEKIEKFYDLTAGEAQSCRPLRDFLNPDRDGSSLPGT